MGHPTAFMAEADVINIVDAEGRDRVICVVGCPVCKGALVIGIKGLAPLHMQNAEALYLIEALRRGRTLETLHRSQHDEKRVLHVEKMRGQPGSWYVGYKDGSDNCDFICSGASPFDTPTGRWVSLTPDQREKLADICFAQLMTHATNVANA